MKTRFVAICPDCEAHQNLSDWPVTWWPHCSECGESMNIYVRSKITENSRQAHTAAQRITP
jgi:Zn ribbon nucleic-acid-binding protein